jgi:glycerol-3-phosphate dehydrogenase
MPAGERTLIGTTDTPYSGSPDSVRVGEDDIAYLLNAVRHYFPKAKTQREDVLGLFVGLRPLALKPGQKMPAPGTIPNASALSRDTEIMRSPSGVITMLGGKYTTHQAMVKTLLSTLEA